MSAWSSDAHATFSRLTIFCGACEATRNRCFSARAGYKFLGRAQKFISMGLLRGPVDGGAEESVYEANLVDEEEAEGGADDSGDRGEVAAGGFEMFAGDGYGDGHGRGHEHHAEDGSEAED